MYKNIDKDLEELNINNIYIKELLSKYYLDLNEQINLIMYIADLFNYNQNNKDNKDNKDKLKEINEIIKFIENKYSNMYDIEISLNHCCKDNNPFLKKVNYIQYKDFINYILMICKNFNTNKLNDNGY